MNSGLDMVPATFSRLLYLPDITVITSALGTVPADLMSGDPVRLQLACAGHVRVSRVLYQFLSLGGEPGRVKELLFFLYTVTGKDPSGPSGPALNIHMFNKLRIKSFFRIDDIRK